MTMKKSGTGRGDTSVRYDTGATVAVTIDGVGAAWNGGVFACADADTLTRIREAAGQGRVIDYNGMDLTCGADNALAALAALLSANPGRAHIIRAPERLIAHVAGGGYPHAGLPGGAGV